MPDHVGLSYKRNWWGLFNHEKLKREVADMPPRKKGAPLVPLKCYLRFFSPRLVNLHPSYRASTAICLFPAFPGDWELGKQAYGC